MNVSTLSQSAVLQSIARVLAESVRPELVLLFGSRARGDAREDSDYDLMLVMRNDADLRDVRSQAYVVLRALGISVDVLAHTVDAYQRHQLDPGFIDWLIAREGVPVYSSGAIPQRVPSRVREPDKMRGGVAAWLKRVDSEYRAAEQAQLAMNPLPDVVCLHSHAAVEKLFKTLIIATTNRYPPKTHELGVLLELLPDTLRVNQTVIDACVLLMEMYPFSRYDEHFIPNVDEAERSLAFAKAVRAIVMPMLEPRP